MFISGFTNFYRTASSDEFRKLIRSAWEVSWPMIIIMGFEFIISVADVYIAGKLGREYQAAVGFSMQIYFIFIVVANSLTVGTVSVVSRLFTSGDRESLSISIYTIFISVLVSGLLFGIAGVLFTSPVVSLLNIPSSVSPIAVPLARIYAAGLIFHYFLINSNGILRAAGMVKKSLMTMGTAAVLNVALNFYFVFHTPLGFYGIALSTAVSVAAASIINFMHVRKLLPHRPLFSRSLLQRVVSIGWPSGLQQISWQAGGTVIFLVLSALPENNVEIIAAFTNGARIESAIFLPAFALNMSNAVIVGNLLGEKRESDAFRAGIITAFAGLILISLLTVLVVVNAAFFASLLSNNTVVIRETIQYIRISMISEPFMALAVILGGALNGAGDTRGMMLIVIFGLWFVRIPLSFLLGITAGLGATAVWWSMNASIFIFSILVLRRYLRRKWFELN